LTIEDKDQPLLFNRAKAKKNGSPDTTTTAEAAQNVICLVPELCYMTGLSDVMKGDISLKKVPSSVL
jgi:hypothetical protein